MRRRIGTSALVLTLALGFLGHPGLLRAQQNQLPQDCVAVIHAPSLKGAVTKVSNLVSQVSPMFGQMVPMLVPKVIGAQSLNGIDMAGEFNAVILNPKRYGSKNVVRIVSLADAQMALQSFGLGAQPEGKQGVANVFAQLDQARWLAATPEQKKNIEQFIRKRLYVAVVGNKALVADSLEACTSTAAMLEAETLNCAAACGTKGDICANVNIKGLMQIYGEDIDRELAPFKRGLRQAAQAAQAQQPDMNPEAMSKMLDSYVNAVVAIVKQLDALELGLALDNDGIRLRAGLAASPESDVANFLRQQAPGGGDVLKMIPSDSFIAASARFKNTQELKDALRGFMEDILNCAPGAMTPDQRTTAIESTEEWMDILTGEVGMGLILAGDGENTGLTLVEVFSVTDAAKAHKLILKQFDQSAIFMSFYRNVAGLDMELAVTENAATHQDVSITEVAILFDPAKVPQKTRDMMRKIYGDPMIVRIAATGKYMIITFGQDSLARMKQTIEFVKAGGGSGLPTQPEFVSATKGFPASTNLLVFVNPKEVVNFVKGMMPPMAGPGAQGAQPELAIAGGIGAYALAKGNRLEGELYISQELIDSLKTIVMGQMGGGMPMPPGRQPAGPPAPR
ncbi:MAG: hypothetical protein GXP25_13235 [Planctomycetes bacterium]|nr:hypothetical protein [Planctomycetota bacterium]